MIPFSFNYLWIFLIASLGSLVFFLFAVGMIFSAKLRSVIRNGNILIRLIFLLSFLCLLLNIGLGILSIIIDNKIKKNGETLNKVLVKDEKVLGIPMPKGTQLELYQPNQLDSFRRATFPQPIQFGNFHVNSIKIARGIDIELFNDRSITLEGEGKDLVEGWPCEISVYIKVYLDRNAKINGLEYCSLAQRVQLNHLEIEPKANIERSKDQKYPDGFVSKDFWIIKDASIKYKNISMSWAYIYLDQDKKLIGIENAILEEDLRIGNIKYPKGTEFNLLVRPLTKQEAWLFIPPEKVNAIDAKGKIYTYQQAILQRPNGAVKQVFDISDPNLMMRTMNRLH
ncbi:hypothetical protein [Acinetobacter baumannii]|uniref:hypothetical protein n=1 Tax=Acinetobacter baumannii TaxID=470 RepID=UPI00112006EC|nr:hypothetical protein [Acinetobacter baumannii]